MTLRAKLSAEHAELDRLADRMLTIVTQTAPPPDFATIRWRLNHVLGVHLAQEDRHLYPALERSSDRLTRALARRFAEEMGGLATIHQRYCVRWPREAIEADWSGFCRDTRAIMQLLRRRIRREELELYIRLEAA